MFHSKNPTPPLNSKVLNPKSISNVKLHFLLQNRVKIIRNKNALTLLHFLLHNGGMNKTKNILLHLWSKFHYEVRYEVGLKHSLLHIHFYSILEKNGVEIKMP